ncbi:1725_t:CDS:2, partial [Paraglomus occultum]
QEGLTLLIHDLDELQGERMSLLPVGDTDQQPEIKFVVEEVATLSTNDGRILLKVQENFEQLNNCQGQTIVIKNPSLVKKSDSLLDIGFSYRGENGELNFERGYEGIIFEETTEEKGVGGVEKAFLVIGVVA